MKCDVHVKKDVYASVLLSSDTTLPPDSVSTARWYFGSQTRLKLKKNLHAFSCPLGRSNSSFPNRYVSMKRSPFFSFFMYSSKKQTEM